LTGLDGLRAVIAQLDGYELAADAWERAVLPARVDGYDASMLDLLCLTGEVGWARLASSRLPRRSSAPEEHASGGGRLVGATPVALFLRENATHWKRANGRAEDGDPPAEAWAFHSKQVLEALRSGGALFTHDLARVTALDAGTVRLALGELVCAGLVASDGFGGLRSMLRGASERPESAARSTVTGRWSLTGGAVIAPDDAVAHEAAVDAQARAFLCRYGVVFRRLLTREASPTPWRELTRVYRRLEARGEIRGGRFVAGMSGEQFALPDAVERLREIRRTQPDGRVLAISAADPLNLAGIVTTGDRVRVSGSNRMAYRDGVPLAVLEGDYVRPLTPEANVEPAVASEMATLLTGRRMPAVLSGFVGR